MVNLRAMAGRPGRLLVPALVALATLSGCASYGPGPLAAGDREADVLARMGAPTERVRHAGGERLVYARGPMGKHTWMVEIGADGRVARIDQALQPERFAAVQPGWSQAQLREFLGPPAEQRALGWQGRSQWGWRFPTNECFWFVATLTAEGRVLDAGQGIDPMCDVKVQE